MIYPIVDDVDGQGQQLINWTNREHPPDYLIRRVEELVGDAPFDDLDRYITRAELQRLSDEYKRIAGFAREHVT